MFCAFFSLCYAQLLACVMWSFELVFCAVFSLCYAQLLACVMCSFEVVFRAVLSLCSVRFYSLSARFARRLASCLVSRC